MSLSRIVSLVVLSAALQCLGSFTWASDCGFSDVVLVSSSETEKAKACESLISVVNYFREIGFSIAPEVRVVFEDTVVLPSCSATGTETGTLVIAYTDTDAKLIKMTSLNASPRPENSRWGLNWGLALGTSFLQHELVHLIMSQVLAEKTSEIAPPWHEALAYSVQVELMEEALGANILRRYKEYYLPAYEEEEIKSSPHEHDPDQFAVRSYRLFVKMGGKEYLKSILQDTLSGGENRH